jgi:hypothetical protein
MQQKPEGGQNNVIILDSDLDLVGKSWDPSSVTSI